MFISLWSIRTLILVLRSRSAVLLPPEARLIRGRIFAPVSTAPLPALRHNATEEMLTIVQTESFEPEK